MFAFTLIAYVLTFCYVFIQGRFYWNWIEFIKEGKASRKPQAPPVKWTVIVPARNEAAHIAQTLESLIDQGAEIIVVNDHSTDATASIVSAIKEVTLLELPPNQSGKKAALSYAISIAKGEWIATMDSDVIASRNWLQSMDAARDENTVAVAGPVMLSPTNTWFERWQALDFCGMMLITAASLRLGDFAMGNGANLAFSKKAFEEVGGYQSPSGKESLSGDDMVLLGKLLKQFSGQLAFASSPEAIVFTPPQNDVKSFVQQRWRWSAKTGLNHQPSLTLILGLVWAFHLGLIAGIPLMLLGLVDSDSLFMAWAFKIIADYVLLRVAARHFDQEEIVLWVYPFQSFVHALYVAGIGTLSLLPFEFEWKGRKARR